MDTLEIIMTRRSVRSFLDRPIPDDALETILRAGMAGPTCVNARDWSFLVSRDPEILSRMAEANGAPAAPLKRAALGILILGDLERAFKPAPDYWVIDGAIAGQNMALAAHALGIGSVWLGTWPQMERVDRQRALFQLPDTVIPHSILAFGYPDPEQADAPPPPGPKAPPPGDAPAPPGMEKGAFEPERIHVDRW